MVVGPVAGLHAQAPDARWLTIRTEHFRVHFTPPLEELARRAAGNAERAYRQLAAELVPPRGTIDLVVADNVDYSNGSATPFPSNRIVVYAHPPVDATSLRFYDDWNTLVVTHELAHIFHLDRSRGWWRVAQRVFGRSPFLFPGQYLPAWVTEGLAVYYESRLTGSGRVAGSQQATIIRAAADAGRFPGLHDLSLATPRFPGGEQPYAFGGLFLDYLARTRGTTSVPSFIETSASAPVPFLLDRQARRAFGSSFTSAWREWGDALARTGGSGGSGRAPDTPGFRTLVGGEWQARGPRWSNEGTLLAGLNPGRELPGAYRMTLDGQVVRIGRRNDAGPQVPLAGGGLLYAQLDFTDPFRLRSDLYIQRGGGEQRLTRGARLFRPDARGDGAIVAVQGMAGTTRLVRLASDGTGLTPITAAVADTQWTEPRWSPDGARLAAIRWRAGGISEVVLLDSLGTVQEVLASARAVQSAPSWSPDGRVIYYSSDESGRPELYRVQVPTSMDGAGERVPRAERLSATSTGLYEPTPSPDGSLLAAVRYMADGWQVVVGEPTVVPPEPQAVGAAAPGGSPSDTPILSPAPPVDGPARSYSPWPTLVPRYWVPILRVGDRDEILAGATTSARDVVGRHSYVLEGAVGTGTGLVEGSFAYRFAGLGNPMLDVGLSQGWQRLALRRRDGTVAGERRRQTRVASMSATVQRPRMRTSAWLAIGGEVERRAYSTDPAPLLGELDRYFQHPRLLPGVRLSAGWSNAQRPFLAISPEDGVAASATLSQRWLDEDVRPVTRSAVGVISGYRSLPRLPGFAHHVLAARVAGGWADDAATGDFEAGGVSGGSVELLPGIVVGEGPRTFGVRGVPAATLHGTRAVAGTLEYRAPLAAPGRGIGALPVFVDRASLVLFADAASAWCPPGALGRPACLGAVTERRWLLSGGAELDLDLAVPYDVGYRGRVGVAFPKADDTVGVTRGARLFVGVGRAF